MAKSECIAMTKENTDENLEESPVNPFTHNFRLTKLQKLQVIFMTVTIVPLRIFLVLTTILVGWLWALVITAGMSNSEPAGPFRRVFLNGWRRILRAIFFFMGFHRIEVVGKRATSEEAPILVAGPHSSMMDLFLFAVSAPIPSGLSAMKNQSVPILGSMSKVIQPLFILRNNRDSKDHIAQEINRRVNEPNKWPQTVIFPEGTCANRTAFLSFKSGAFVPGVPIQPAIIEYFNDYDSFSWTVHHIGTWTVMWMCLCQFSVKAKLTYLPVYCPSEKEKEDPKLFAKNVRNVMAEAANLPCTEHAYEDCRLMWKAESLGLPLDSGRVEFAKLRQKFGLSYDSIRDILVEFSNIASHKKDGLLSLEVIKKLSHFSPELKNWYHQHSVNGFINFRNYLIGLTLMPRKHETKPTAKISDVLEIDNELHNKKSLDRV